MPNQSDSFLRLVRVFLSSPGDVADERSLALKVLETLHYDPLFHGRIMLETVAWDKPGAGTPLLATMTPQEAINRQLAKPSECDIVIVIFWARMGTPLPPEYTKPDGSRYFSGTEWEYEDALQAARQGGGPDVLVYRRTEKVLLDLGDPTFDHKREQFQRVEAFFEKFTHTDGSIRQGYNAYTTPDEFREKLEGHLRQMLMRHLPLRARDRRVARRPTPMPKLWQGSPFPGLRAFMPNDAPIFFGRGRETDGLIKRLAAPEARFVAVVGASGSGKSSLVGAGLLPRLKDNAIEGSKDWVVVRFTPGKTPGELGGDPLLALAVALLGQATPSNNQPTTHLLADSLAKEPQALEQAVSQALTGCPEWAKLLLFIDQFEELFTLTEPTQRMTFITLLVRAVTLDQVRVVVTLRADLYHRCVEVPALAELLRTGSYPLAAPEVGALYEMIARPAERAGLQFEDGLPERILTDLGSDPGALPLMAYALDELHRVREPGGRLTFAAYEAFGGVQGAIGTRAEDAFKALPAHVQATLADVFRNLVEVDERGIATRQRANLSRFDSRNAIHLVNALTEARLLVQNQDDDEEPTVEVAHEALLRSWPRLAGWIETMQDDLRILRAAKVAAAEWVRNDYDPLYLWPNERLQVVYDMLDRFKPTLDEVTYDFIRSEGERLVDEINRDKTDHRRRAAIGERLDAIGDPRSGVGLKLSGLPDIEWCEMKGGKIRLGRRGGTHVIEPFYIGKYVVTYTQYRAFLEAEDGYKNLQWWEGLPRRYFAPHTQHRPFGNHPADNVGWDDAMAFCRWASAKLGFEIRLPSEWEWQLAATGGLYKNVWPWGNEWQDNCANTDRNDLSQTVAVGLYPRGAARCGALDMSGNIKEWCLNEYNDKKGEATNGAVRCAIRGGSWAHSPALARTFARNAANTHGRNDFTGFRLACTNPIFSD